MNTRLASCAVALLMLAGCDPVSPAAEPDRASETERPEAGMVDAGGGVRSGAEQYLEDEYDLSAEQVELWLPASAEGPAIASHAHASWPDRFAGVELDHAARRIAVHLVGASERDAVELRDTFPVAARWLVVEPATASLDELAAQQQLIGSYVDRRYGSDEVAISIDIARNSIVVSSDDLSLDAQRRIRRQFPDAHIEFVSEEVEPLVPPEGDDEALAVPSGALMGGG